MQIDGRAPECKVSMPPQGSEMNDTVRDRIREVMTGRRARQFELLKELVRVSSENPPGDTEPLARRLDELLAGMGFVVERHVVDPELARRLGRGKLTNLVVRHRFGDGPVLALQANGDTAPAGGNWRREPFGAEIEKGTLYGRGAVASKGNIAAFAFALEALIEARAELAGTVELHLTFDGEAGGALGPKWLLDTGVVKPDYAIGAGLTHAVVTHVNGVLRLEVELRGKATPAHRAREGEDALEAAAHLLTTVFGLRRGLAATVSEVPGCGSPSLVVGRIEGGSGIANVPDTVKMTIGRRLIPEEDPAKVERQLTEAIGNTVARTSSVMCRIRRTQMIAPMKPTAGTERLAETIARQAAGVLEHAPERRGLPYDADARHYAAAGIPTVLFGAGPADPAAAGVGGPDEGLALDDLRRATEIVALTASELLAKPPSAPQTRTAGAASAAT